MDSFIGREPIELLSGDDSLGYAFSIQPCSSVTSNDGHIPYGTNISSVSVTIVDGDGEDYADEILQDTDIDENIVTLSLSYPTSDTTGKHTINILATLDNGSVKHLKFNRLFIG